MSFLQVKLASQKDNCWSCIPAVVEKFDRICVEVAIKLKLLTFRFFCFWKICREPVEEVIYRKKEWGHRAHKRVRRIYRYKNTHHHCILGVSMEAYRRSICLLFQYVAQRSKMHSNPLGPSEKNSFC